VFFRRVIAAPNGNAKGGLFKSAVADQHSPSGAKAPWFMAVYGGAEAPPLQNEDLTLQNEDLTLQAKTSL
jgi:hypothetical protein